MNKTIILLSAITIGALFTITSCEKKGCTFPAATNFDASAKADDGSCIFGNTPGTSDRDKFVGSYAVRDSVFGTDGINYSLVKVINYITIIEKVDSPTNRVLLKNFATSGSYDIKGTVSGKDIVMSEPFNAWTGFGTLSNDTLRFQFDDSYDRHRGFGIKQP